MSKLSITIDGQAFEVEIGSLYPGDDQVTVQVNGEPVVVTLSSPSDPSQIEWALIDQRPYELRIDSDLRWIQSAHGHHEVQIRDGEVSVARPVSTDGRIKAPIPGVVLHTLVEEGQLVTPGQPIIVLEAMKMENEITAPRAGTLQQILVSPGQIVKLNEVLAEIQ
jgi:biotin carboxyl carrier protein